MMYQTNLTLYVPSRYETNRMYINLMFQDNTV